MKLFQQLLIAPAALGLLAPLAATANEATLNQVASEDLSAGQFSDFETKPENYHVLKEWMEQFKKSSDENILIEGINISGRSAVSDTARERTNRKESEEIDN